MVMSIRTSTSLTLLFLSALVACSAEPGSESAAAGEMSQPSLPAPGAEEASSSPIELSKVAEITVAGATIEMSEIVGSPDTPIVISESFDMKRGSVLQRLTEAQPLTALEIFVNLQPEADVPEVLSERHAAETVALGRSDTSVLNVAFDPNAVIEKWSSAGCDSVIFGNEGTSPGKIQYSRKQRLNNANGHRSLRIADQMSWVFTSSDVNLGVCNNATTTSTWYLGFARAGDTGETRYTAWLPVNAGHASWYYRLYLGTLVPAACAPGLICPPVRSTVFYHAFGDGTNYHMRTAEARVVPGNVL
jgi:hypothetical protein